MNSEIKQTMIVLLGLAIVIGICVTINIWIDWHYKLLYVHADMIKMQCVWSSIFSYVKEIIETIVKIF